MNQIRASTQLGCIALFTLFREVPSPSGPQPRSMKWETNGELAQNDLSELVNRLLDVEKNHHSDELSRLRTKCEDSV